MLKLILNLVLASLFSTVSAQDVEIMPIGRNVKNFSDASLPSSVSDGFIVYIYIVNNGDREITLPSKLLKPWLIQREQQVEVEFAYHPQEIVSKSGRRTLIPSRESFAPVTLRRGEAMLLDPFPFTIERKQFEPNGLVFTLTTKGFLSDRLGFTRVDLKGALITPDFELAPPAREP